MVLVEGSVTTHLWQKSCIKPFHIAIEFGQGGELLSCEGHNPRATPTEQQHG